MRQIDEIIIHCTATPEGREVSAAEIGRWHRQRGFDGIGYHYVVHMDGRIEGGRPLEKAGVHCSGHNARSIGIAYVGGCDAAMQPKDTRTEAQCASLARLVKQLQAQYTGATIHGHNEYAAKACPAFDVREWIKKLK